jgi:phosphatidate cytidylyltransferase
MKNFLIRSVSGLIFAGILVVGSLFIPAVLYAVLGIFLIIGLSELINLLHLKIEAVWFVVLALAFSLMYLFVSALINDIYFNESELLFAPIIAVALILIYLAGAVFSQKPARDMVSAFSISLLYLFIPIVIVLFLQQFKLSRDGISWLLIVLAIIWINDTMAYIVGSLLGKHPLVARISPKKTIEGVVGGLFFVLASTIVANELFLEKNLISMLIFSTTMVLAGTVGDLLESKLKREAGVKDSGNIMPGHGGILDRLDSLLVASPFAFVCLLIFNWI